MHKKAKAAFWTSEEVDLSKDVHDWNNHLNDNEHHFILHVLTFFTASNHLLIPSTHHLIHRRSLVWSTYLFSRGLAGLTMSVAQAWTYTLHLLLLNKSLAYFRKI